jgi:hypothetical protein
MREAADISDTSCSPDFPPNNTATRSFLFILTQPFQSPSSGNAFHFITYSTFAPAETGSTGSLARTGTTPRDKKISPEAGDPKGTNPR